MMLPGRLLVPLLVGTAIFWVLGPAWSWIPFNVVFGILTLITLIAGPTRIVLVAPSAAQSTSSTFTLVMLLAIAVGIGLLVRGRYWELVACVVVLLISAWLWPRLRIAGRSGPGPDLGQRKVKITKTEFASVLDFCLSKGFELESPGESIAKSIAKTAEDIDFKITNKNDSNRLFQELLILYMWVILRACTKVFSDADKRNACLDIFHRNVYETYYKDTTEQGFSQWIKSFGLKYIEYEKATEKADEPGPIWWLTKAVNQNIFGEVKKDPRVQMHISHRIATFMEYVDKVLGETLKKSEIE